MLKAKRLSITSKDIWILKTSEAIKYLTNLPYLCVVTITAILSAAIIGNVPDVDAEKVLMCAKTAIIAATALNLMLTYLLMIMFSQTVDEELNILTRAGNIAYVTTRERKRAYLNNSHGYDVIIGLSNGRTLNSAIFERVRLCEDTMINFDIAHRTITGNIENR